MICLNTCAKWYSQSLRIAVFDIDSMVHALPEYKVVDSLVMCYEIDTIPTDYKILQQELVRLDRFFLNYRDQSHDRKFDDSIGALRQKIELSIIYWKQNSEHATNERKRRLAEPLYQKVNAAFKKIISEKHYDLILKSGSIEFGDNVDNLFIPVARKLKLASLPVSLLKIGNLYRLDSLSNEIIQY